MMMRIMSCCRDNHSLNLGFTKYRNGFLFNLSAISASDLKYSLCEWDKADASSRLMAGVVCLKMVGWTDGFRFNIDGAGVPDDDAPPDNGDAAPDGRINDAVLQLPRFGVPGDDKGSVGRFVLMDE